MSREVVIRTAREDDGAFIASFVPSLLEFGSPAWRDKDALGPGFAELLTRALHDQDLRSSMLTAQGGSRSATRQPGTIGDPELEVTCGCLPSLRDQWLCRQNATSATTNAAASHT
jgi:hypothetical protein